MRISAGVREEGGGSGGFGPFEAKMATIVMFHLDGRTRNQDTGTRYPLSTEYFGCRLL